MTSLTHSKVATHGHHEDDAKVIFGFWIYIMTDCLLFASLFATYAVMRNSTYGGPGGGELFGLPFALMETLILLTSSFTTGLGMLAAHKNSKAGVVSWLVVTLMLGLSFLGMEFTEFSRFYAEGHDWTQSGFLSAFFTLVGTHGLHVLTGAVWMLILILQIAMNGLSGASLRRLTCLSLFWHFLDVIWIFIFTFVYLISTI